MTEATENLVLEQLRHIRATGEATRGELRDLRNRVSSMERGLADVQVSIAMLNGRLDQFGDRLERLEQRLGLVDA